MKKIDNIDNSSYQRSYSLDNKQKKESQSNTTIDKIDIKLNTRNHETRIAVYKEPLLPFKLNESTGIKYEQFIDDSSNTNIKLTEDKFFDNFSKDKVEINKKDTTYNISNLLEKQNDINKFDLILDKENYAHLAQSNVQKVMDLVFSDHNSFNKVYDKSILVLGNTGSGKSTLVNYLAKVPLFAVDDDGETKICCNEDKEIVKIGNTSGSTTILPQKWIADDGTVFWDCPGFKDNRSVVLDIANSFYRTNIVGKSKSIKLMFLMPYSDTKGRANGLMDLVQTIDDLFYGEANKCANACVLVITKVPKEVSINNIQTRLFKMSDNMGNRQKDIVSQLAKNISIFNEPDIDDDLSKEEFGFNRKEILKKIEKIGCLTEGVRINNVPSNKSMLEIIKWYQDITNDILAQFKDSNQDLISSFGERSLSKNSLKDVLYICDKLNSKFERIEDIATFDLVSFTENIKSLNKGLAEVSLNINIDYEKFLSDSVQKQMSFLEDFFVEPAVTLTFRSGLLREFKHFLTDLKFEASIKLEPNRFNELQIDRKNSHVEHEGMHYKFYEYTMKMVQENKINVAIGSSVSIGGGIGIGMIVAHGATIGIVGGPIGLVVGGLIGLGYSIYKYYNPSNNNSN